MDDLIKRKDAIEAINECYALVVSSRLRARKALENIPSADIPQGKVDAVEIYEKAKRQIDGNKITLGEFEKIIEQLRHLSYDRPQGEWVKHDEERDYCSRCKHIFKTRTITKQDKWTNYIDDLGYNYCPNCGARMKGADDERVR